MAVAGGIKKGDLRPVDHDRRVKADLDEPRAREGQGQDDRLLRLDVVVEVPA